MAIVVQELIREVVTYLVLKRNLIFVAIVDSSVQYSVMYDLFGRNYPFSTIVKEPYDNLMSSICNTTACSIISEKDLPCCDFIFLMLNMYSMK